ncbi:Fe-S cluster assembly protein SufD [soil metagenome]
MNTVTAMTAIHPSAQVFSAQFDKLELTNTPMSVARRPAFEAFEQMGIPTTRHEDWKYTNVAAQFKNGLQDITGLDFTDVDIDQLNLFPFLKANKLVFVNGRYSPALSDVIDEAEGLVIGSLAQYNEQGHLGLRENYNHLARNEKEAFTALNTAFAKDGPFIYVPAKVEVAHPVIVVQVTTDGLLGVINSRGLVITGRSSRVEIIESHQYIGSDETALTNQVLEIVVGDNALVNYHKLMTDANIGRHVGNLAVKQGNDSRFNTYVVNLAGQLVRNNMVVAIDGKNSEAGFYGLYSVGGLSHIDNHVTVNHNEPHCESHQLFKGLLDDKSTGVFNGRIYVKQDAQKTNAFQSNKTILLSDNANTFTKPQLEIFADDVKCSHGATTGQIDQNMLFYLRARGLDAAQAKAMLNQAFAADVIDKITNEPLKEWLLEQLNLQLND